jgi:hypothetical protein
MVFTGRTASVVWTSIPADSSSADCRILGVHASPASQVLDDAPAEDGTGRTDGSCQLGSCDRSPVFLSQPKTGARCGQADA